jgi:hypothetical protein
MSAPEVVGLLASKSFFHRDNPGECGLCAEGLGAEAAAEWRCLLNPAICVIAWHSVLMKYD